MKIAIVGATGLVGRKMLKVLEERNLGFSELILVASANSVGKMIPFGDKEFPVVSLEQAIAAKPQIALFSAGAETSRKWAKKFTEIGTFVIDNSSAWRMFDDIPLVVPEINGEAITTTHRLISNPNCSTIQMVMALAPLHKAFGIKRIIVSTYQSVTGSGMNGRNQLARERCDLPADLFYPHQIDLNLIPHGGSFNADGYTSEEQKLVDETRKILNDQAIQITATVVRVPVFGGHSESVNIELNKPFEMEEIIGHLSEMPGITIQDDPAGAVYPMPLFAEDKDDVFVGRIRRDYSVQNGVNLWIVSDNLRKGAATNAVQIAEYLIENSFV